eukprot:Lithocolla_globosa_v1_NODE_814_length_3238_cov_52.363179.p1 type:complete len:315 gc:universal NODE_814_length_3238_cov_52.363179:731-1675(+)
MPCGAGKLITDIDFDFEYNRLKTNQVFGFMKLDIHVPKKLYTYFGEMPPIFKNIEYDHSKENIGEYMATMYAEVEKKHEKTRKLIGSMKGDGIVLGTPYIKWLIDHGCIITKIHRVIEFERGRPYEPFMNYVADARRAGDKDSDLVEVLANGAKLAGNGAAGNCIINKFSHNSVSFTESMDRTYQAVNKPKCKQLNEFGIESNTIFEITSGKKTIKLDNAVHIGVMVYNWAKVRMLGFYYDHLDKFHDRRDFALGEMGTDSFYTAITVDSFDKLPVRPGMEAEYLEDKWKWLVNPKNNAYEKRTPGYLRKNLLG